MTKHITFAVTALSLAALFLGNSASAIDPRYATTPSTVQSVPQPLDPYAIPYGTATPGSSIPAGQYPADNRDRLIQPGTINSAANITPISYPGAVNPNLTYPPAVTYPNGTTNSLKVSPSYVPPGTIPTPKQPARWRLGVYSKDTEIGVRIAQVVPNSAAARAGLEANDLIVNVAGFQVGYVSGELFDCGQEFERNADADGWVKLLVQNGRDGQLVNLPVKLDSRFQQITGSITYQERYALPRDAVATVELREILRAGAPPTTLSRKVINQITQIPINFAVDFDPSQIDRNRQYVLSASITSSGRTLFSSREMVTCINDGRTTNVPVLVQSTTITQPGSNYVSIDDQLAQLTMFYRQYLHREPRALELATYRRHFERGGSLYEAQSDLLATNEFYNQSDADDATYITRLHELVLNKQPSKEELDYWMGRMKANQRLRPELAREFLVAVGTPR
ncbi:MAG: YbaY family lipoprotein [Planctomycetaceae bacterium]